MKLQLLACPLCISSLPHLLLRGRGIQPIRYMQQTVRNFRMSSAQSLTQSTKWKVNPKDMTGFTNTGLIMKQVWVHRVLELLKQEINFEESIIFEYISGMGSVYISHLRDHHKVSIVWMQSSKNGEFSWEYSTSCRHIRNTSLGWEMKSWGLPPKGESYCLLVCLIS